MNPDNTVGGTPHTSSRPTKRARTEGVDYSSYVQDPDYYLHDGTVVLAADAVLFKIHQSVLARHSSVFHDTFGLPRPVDGGGNDLLDGVPVLDLDDTKDDLKVMIRLIYDPPPVEVSFDTIESALRMSQKYDVDQLLMWGLHCLGEYPTTMTSAYKHPKWPLYKNPFFCTRVIGLTELLDNRVLDETAAMAYYALSVVDWTKYDRLKVLGGLPATAVERLTRGQRNLFHLHSSILSELLDHQCPPTGFHSDMNACIKRKNAVVKTLIHSMNGDFIETLIAISAVPGSGFCRGIDLASTSQMVLRGISKAFGLDSGGI